MSKPISLNLPLTEDAVRRLKAGDRVLFSGVLFTARDAAHRRMVEAIKAGEPLPFDPRGAVIYYVGPAPAKPGRPIGPAGPTTSGRMDAFAPVLMELGVRGMIGKGSRSEAVREAMTRHRAVYFAATGGAAALLARSIKAAEVIAYPDLGPEAVHRLVVEDFPAVVVNDVHGGDLYVTGVDAYRRES